MSEIDQIQREMSRIRASLRREASNVVEGAERALDWRTYVMDAPWITLSAAVALGYVLVPKRQKLNVTAALSPDLTRQIEQVAQMGGEGRRQAQVQERGPSAWSLVRTALGFAAPIALHAARTYAANWVESRLMAPNGQESVPVGRPASPGSPRFTPMG